MSSCCESSGKSCCADDSKVNEESIQNVVKDYYGKRIKKTDDLLTSACLTSGAPPPHIREVMSLLHSDVTSTYYGCGLVVPEILEGMRILDLGSGSGHDCFILSKLVGESGYIVGVDMTDEQLLIANKNIDFHTKAFGFSKPNVEFKKGYIERLEELDLPENSFDIIVSNCVINLVADKKAVLASAHRLLKPGGEIYFSDVYADRRVPVSLQQDPVLWGECLTGALYWNDFLHLARNIGFFDPRVVSSRKIELVGKVASILAPIEFYSAEFRLFKLNTLELECEDYGQAVCYLGTVATSPNELVFDQNCRFPKGKIQTVSGNTFSILEESRFAPHFKFFGDKSVHFGAFTQKKVDPLSTTDLAKMTSSCCQ